MRSRAGDSPTNSVVTTDPIPGSRKRHRAGPGGVRVPYREVELSPTRSAAGVELNPPLALYDTSGPYTDPDAAIDVRSGLAPLRRPWIDARGPYDRMAPSYRAVPGHSDADLPLPPRRRVLRSRGNATQLHYARRGVVTPEMEFIAHPRGARRRVRALRGGARPRDHSRQRQPPRARADDHRPELPREDQRQHRQLRRLLVDRGGSGQAALGDAVGRRHGDGPLDRDEHPRDARVDPAQLARADRHGADLPGAREGRRQAGGADLGGLPRHAHRAGGAGRRLLHRPRRRAPCATCR